MSETEKLIVQARGFVQEADNSITARSDWMCVDSCCCDIDDKTLWAGANIDWCAVDGTVATWS